MNQRTVLTKLTDIDLGEADVIIRIHRDDGVVEARVDAVYSEAKGAGPFRVIVEGDERWSTIYEHVRNEH